MKLSYYGYCFTEVKSGKKKIMSAHNFFRAFCAYSNPIFKNKFTHNGEQVFFLNSVGNLYLFLQTRSDELIKKINLNNISVGEIYDLLDTGELIGFASYIYLKESYLGFASTIMAPRVGSFVCFVNNLLNSIGVTGYQFTLIPLLHQVSRADAIAMPFIGKSTIQINSSNSMFDDIRNFAGGTAEEFKDVDSFELVLKPKRKQDISKAVKKVISAVPDAGLEKMIVRAKDELHGSLVDLYLAGKGIVADNIDTKDESVVAQKIDEKIKINPVLQEKVAAYEQDDSFTKKDIDGIAKFSDVGAWAHSFSDV